MMRLTVTAAALLLATAAAMPAQAKSMKDCAADWQAAKAAGTTGTMKYTDFSKQCMSGTATTASAPAPAKPVAAAPAPVKPVAATPAPVKPAKVVAAAPAADPSLDTNQAPPAAPTMPAPAGVVFPKAVAAAYASEPAGKARMHTCVDAYHAAKSANALGGLKWIEKGGGYYSLCNASIKG